MNIDSNGTAASRVRTVLRRGLAAGLALGLVIGAAAQPTQPTQPILMIVPFGVGGGADLLARQSAPLLQVEARAPVTVTNVPGATGNEGIAQLLAARSDGRTLAILTGDTYATLAFENPSWKPADVIPLAIMMRQTSALFIAANSRFGNWQDFEKEARARPSGLRVAISGLGSPDYIVLQQFAAKNIHLAPVPLANPLDRYQALLSGQADALYEQPGDVREFLDSARIRPILMFDSARAPMFKDVPTSGELGYGNGVAQFRAIVVKAGTDPQIVATLVGAFARIAASADFKTFLDRQLAAADSFVAPDAARTLMQRELSVMRKIVESLPMHARNPIEEKGSQVATPTF